MVASTTTHTSQGKSLLTSIKKVCEEVELATMSTDELSFAEAGLTAGMVLDIVATMLSKVTEGACRASRYEKLEVSETSRGSLSPPSRQRRIELPPAERKFRSLTERLTLSQSCCSGSWCRRFQERRSIFCVSECRGYQVVHHGRAELSQSVSGLNFRSAMTESNVETASSLPLQFWQNP